MTGGPPALNAGVARLAGAASSVGSAALRWLATGHRPQRYRLRRGVARAALGDKRQTPPAPPSRGAAVRSPAGLGASEPGLRPAQLTMPPIHG